MESNICSMERFIGILGIVFILGFCFLFSKDRRAINYRSVVTGLLLQWALALFILKTSAGTAMFKVVGDGVTSILKFSDKGAEFVFGNMVNVPLLGKVFGDNNGFIFFFKVIPTILFVAVIVNILYYLKIMQFIVSLLAKGMKWLMDVSGAEALSNIASAFVGQVEAQLMIKPYLKTMTRSELMSSMTGSFACISGGVMATYISFGIPASYLLAASIMAAPGALAISKILYPELEVSQTKGDVVMTVPKQFSNLMDAIKSGCSDGLKIGLNVTAMLIGFIALLGLLDYTSAAFFSYFFKINDLTLTAIIGKAFSGVAYLLGVSWKDTGVAGELMGIKLFANEFVAYSKLRSMLGGSLDPRSITIITFALCGFANFSSVGIQIGGISGIEPSRRDDLLKLSLRALLAGTLTSYLSAAIAGLLS